METTSDNLVLADTRKRERRRLADLLDEHAASMRLVALLLRLNHDPADRG